MTDARPTPTSALDISRRATLGLIAASAAGFALLGPRPREGIPSGRIVLDYWEKWTGAEGLAMQRLVDRFNASQSDIFVRYLSIGAIDQKAMIAVAGRSPPDILGLWSFNIPAFAEAGALMPLGDLAAKHNIVPARYARAVWPMMTHHDQLYALISTCGTVALYINDDRLAEAGLAGAPAPTTIEELDALGDVLLERRPNGDIEKLGFIHTDPGWWSWLWGYHFGGSLLDEATNTATASAPENIAAYEWVQSYPKKFGARDLSRFQSGVGFYGTAQAPFLTGRVALTIQGPWMANLIAAFRPDLNYRVVPMPTTASIADADNPVGLVDGDMLTIPTGAREPEASFAFIAWVQQQKQLEELAAAHAKNSPLSEVSESFITAHPNRGIAAHNAIAASPRAFRFPKTRVWPRYVAEFDAAFQRLWLLEDQPAAMLSRINQRAQAALDQAADMRERRRP